MSDLPKPLPDPEAEPVNAYGETAAERREHFAYLYGDPPMTTEETLRATGIAEFYPKEHRP